MDDVVGCETRVGYTTGAHGFIFISRTRRDPVWSPPERLDGFSFSATVDLNTTPVDISQEDINVDADRSSMYSDNRCQMITLAVRG